MSDENAPPVYLMCSACRTPCVADDAHVIPRWNPDMRRVFTTYRCDRCFPRSLDETRAAVTSGDAEVVASFCDFLARHGYVEDAATIRAAPSQQARAHMVAILDAVLERKVVFLP